MLAHIIIETVSTAQIAKGGGGLNEQREAFHIISFLTYYGIPFRKK
jgi:hypothetical protein